MYMLNLLFDLDDTNGVFTGDYTGAGSSILTKSKNWLRQPNPNPANPFAPGIVWTDLGDGPLLIPAPIGEAIGVRVLPTPAKPALPAGATLDLMVAFGAIDTLRTPHASPFTSGVAPNETLAVFRLSTVLPAQGFWYLPLGTIAKKPTNPNKSHRYEFVVGAIVNSAGTICTYGHDPEMDIGF
jgi:hypothetical protein